jgi:dTDP-glucose 4,6-dehydratase
MDVRVVRIFNTYGPRMRIDDGRVLPTFMAQALMGLPLTVFGDGSQTRSFCYVGDMVEGIYRVATFRLTSRDEPTIVNLGNPEEVSILQLAHEVIEVTGGRSGVIFQPLPVNDPVRRKPDISRVKQLLGWEPKITRHEGLEHSLSYFRAALSVKPLIG